MRMKDRSMKIQMRVMKHFLAATLAMFAAMISPAHAATCMTSGGDKACQPEQPYGDWEFEVRDPNGYMLVCSELAE